jgi:hypothetical protein
MMKMIWIYSLIFFLILVIVTNVMLYLKVDSMPEYLCHKGKLIKQIDITNKVYLQNKKYICETNKDSIIITLKD